LISGLQSCKCKKCGHQQANSAVRMQGHCTKCSMDSVSSASIEWISSNFGNVHTKMHNPLGNSKTLRWYSVIGFSEAALN